MQLKWKTALLLGLVQCGGGGIPTTPAPFALENQPKVPAVHNEAVLHPEWDLACPTGSWLTYENFGQGFMNRACTTCHHSDLAEGARAGAPLMVNLNTLDGVLTWREKILTTTTALPVERNTMPPVNTINAWERHALQEWLACGAPSNPG